MVETILPLMALKLRPYQEQVKSRIYSEWESHPNVLCVMPTGAGKTKLFCSIIIDTAVTPHSKLNTAVLVHRKELVQQISLTLAEEQIVHNIIAPQATVMQIISAQRRVYNSQYYHHASPISVISVDTLNARAGRMEQWAQGIKQWIVDEAAHVLKDNKWGRATAMFPNAIRGLGVTATPERLDGKGLGSHAKGVFDTMVEGPSVRWLIDRGFLSKYKVVVPRSDYEKFLKRSSSTADFSKANMEEAAQKSQIVGDVVENYIKWALNKQAILFAPSINIAHEMEARFIAAGIAAQVLTGESTDLERLNGMLDFRDKRTQVLINVDLFDEGLDVPGIECVIMARPTMSLGKYRQMVGRGLRVMEGKPFCLIIDHVGNCTRHQLPCDPYKWSLDDRVKRKKKVNLLRICANPTCQSPFDRTLTTCPWCGTEVESTGGGGGRVPPDQVDGDLLLIDPESLREMDEATILEDPDSVGNRVAHAAGTPAGIKAARQQAERIKAQDKLKESIAIWAGFKRDEGLSDREIHKAFYLLHGQTIAQTLAEPKRIMDEIRKEIMGSIEDERKRASTTYTN